MISFTVYGEPASKSNSRRLIWVGRKPRIIKSQKALDYVDTVKKQAPKKNPIIDYDIAIEIHMFYASRRPDMDDSALIDALQDIVYKNDRQIKEKHMYWYLDKRNPRCEIKIWKK